MQVSQDGLYVKIQLESVYYQPASGSNKSADASKNWASDKKGCEVGAVHNSATVACESYR